MGEGPVKLLAGLFDQLQREIIAVAFHKSEE